MEASPLIVITGPTASGKTGRAISLARALGGEVISADSRQVYRGMDLGTGKDLEEYGNVPFHLIDIADAGYKYNLYEYLRDFSQAEQRVRQNCHVPIMCGGTGLYVESVLKGINLPEVPANPELRAELAHKSLAELTEMLESRKTLHNTTDVDTVKRAIRALEIEIFYEQHPELALGATPHPRLDAVVIGIDIPREARRQRITTRLHARLEAGMVEEVENLLKSGIKAEDLEYYGLEYKYLTQYVTGKLTCQEMKSQLEIAIHQFAKRQMTWFRGMERRGFIIHWLSYDLTEEDFLSQAKEVISAKGET